MTDKSAKAAAEKEAPHAKHAPAAAAYGQPVHGTPKVATHANLPAAGPSQGGAPAPEPGTGAGPLFPSVGAIVQAGAFGAALAGVTTGVLELARVKQGEITTDEALQAVVKSSAQGAATMAVASIAAHVVRAHPVFGFIALASAGIGAFVLLSGANAPAAPPAASVPTAAAKKPAAKKPA